MACMFCVLSVIDTLTAIITFLIVSCCLDLQFLYNYVNVRPPVHLLIDNIQTQEFAHLQVLLQSATDGTLIALLSRTLLA